MIECKNLTKIYKNGDIETVALRSASFKVEEGEFVAIIGPSGSGKSTLMHIIGALDTPTSGAYFIENADISKLDDDELSELRKRKIGFVFQQFNLLPRASVLRNVMLPLLYLNVSDKEKKNKAIEALKSAGLEESKYNNLSNQLSGGQMQRVSIARALINNPSIILADEPTGNLDSKTSQVIMEAFQALHKKGHTIILITHEADIAAYSKRIISLRDGVIESDVKNDKRLN